MVTVCEPESLEPAGRKNGKNKSKETIKGGKRGGLRPKKQAGSARKNGPTNVGENIYFSVEPDQ